MWRRFYVLVRHSGGFSAPSRYIAFLFSVVRLLVIQEVHHLDNLYRCTLHLGLVAHNESPLVEAGKHRLHINAFPVREYLCFNPERPVLHSSFPVGQHPESLEQQGDEWVGSSKNFVGQ